MVSSNKQAATTANTETMEQTRLAMRRLAASVSVVSAADKQGQPFAMTATSVTSVSMEPPSLLVCVNSWAAIHSTLTLKQPFCINILNNQQQMIAELCSQGPENRDRMSLGNWQNNSAGTPYLADAQASLFCITDKSICYASHTIFIGRVKSVKLHGDVSPLIYLDGHYINAQKREG